MREIKFRGYANGKMINLQGASLPFKTEGHFPGGSKVFSMQYTGLKDKNGKEIYEGDIVKWQHQRYDKNPRISTVKYDNRLCGFTINGTYFSALDTALETLEVIGNIHENPELLNIKGKI